MIDKVYASTPKAKSAFEDLESGPYEADFDSNAFWASWERARALPCKDPDVVPQPKIR